MEVVEELVRNAEADKHQTVVNVIVAQGVSSFGAGCAAFASRSGRKGKGLRGRKYAPPFAEN